MFGEHVEGLQETFAPWASAVGTELLHSELQETLVELFEWDAAHTALSCFDPHTESDPHPHPHPETHPCAETDTYTNTNTNTDTNTNTYTYTPSPSEHSHTDAPTTHEDLSEPSDPAGHNPERRGILSSRQREAIVALHTEGMSFRKVARAVGCTLSAVQYTVRKYKRLHTTAALPRTGRTPLLRAVPDDVFFAAYRATAQAQPEFQSHKSPSHYSPPTHRDRLCAAALRLAPLIGHTPSHKTVYKELVRRRAQSPNHTDQQSAC